ncbi:MAG: CvpA family protein [Rikenellaceae bacterium]
MNAIDIIILLILAYALFEGFREGLVVQACSIIGIAIAIWCGAKYGDWIAALFQIEGEYSSTWGFVITLILAIILVGIAARLARKVLHFAGLGVVDHLLGMVISVVKYLIVMSLVLSAFGFINSNIEMVSSNTLAKSKFYQPIVNVTNWATPAWNWTLQQFE